jgi:hypothetical protein
MSSHLQPSLVTLPQEILDEISCRITARADLSSLSMTSKTLRTATVELLYKDITMTWNCAVGLDSDDMSVFEPFCIVVRCMFGEIRQQGHFLSL